MKPSYIYNLDDHPPIRYSLLYGFQWAMIMFPGLIIAASLSVGSFPPGALDHVYFLQMTLLTSGLFTWLQTLWGHRYPLLEGPSTALRLAFILLAPLGLPAIQGGMILGAVLLILTVLSGQLGRVTVFFTPNVIGVILMLVSLGLIRPPIGFMTGGRATEGGVFLISVFLVLLIAGLSHWLQGGIEHPLLGHYAQDQGNWYLLTKKMQPLLSPFHKNTPRFPRFLTDTAERDVFDLFVTAGSRRTWFVDWAQKSFGQQLGLAEINELYRLVVQALSHHGLLKKHSKGTANAYGLIPKNIWVTKDAAILKCDQCGHLQTVANYDLTHWLGCNCLSYRCQGRYSQEAQASQHYYREVYQRGQVERIFAHEHTGLLRRETREKHRIPAARLSSYSNGRRQTRMGVRRRVDPESYLNPCAHPGLRHFPAPS